MKKKNHHGSCPPHHNLTLCPTTLESFTKTMRAICNFEEAKFGERSSNLYQTANTVRAKNQPATTNRLVEYKKQLTCPKTCPILSLASLGLA